MNIVISIMLSILAATGLNLEQKLKFKHLSQQCPAATYIPNAAQHDTNLAIGNQQETGNKIFLITSANGTGKTTTMVNVIGNIVWPGLNIYNYARNVETKKKYNGFFDAPLYRKWPTGWPKVIWIIAEAGTGIETIINEINNWWPKNSYAYKEFKDGKRFVARIVTDNGWTIYMKTTEQDKRAFESGNVGLVWYDEPPKKWQFDAGISRLRKGGFIVITATPVFDAGWFIDRIVERIDIEKADQGFTDKWHKTVDVFANSVDHAGLWDLGIFGIQKKGNLLRPELDFIVRNCDEEEAPARLYGQFVHLSGLVYKGYDKKLHNRYLTWDHPKLHYMYRMIIDPHGGRRFPAICWVRIEPNGRRYVFAEWPDVKKGPAIGKYFYQLKDAQDMTLKDFVRAIIEVEQEWQIPLSRIKRIMDPNYSKIKESDSGLEIHRLYSRESKKVYKELGYKEGTQFSFITNAKDEILTGHSEVKKLLKSDSYGPNEIVSPDCMNTDLAYRRYAWKEHEGKRAEHDSPSEALKTLHKDFMDLRRYDAVVSFTWQPLERMSVGIEQDYEEPAFGVSNGTDWRALALDKVRRPEGDAGA